MLLGAILVLWVVKDPWIAQHIDPCSDWLSSSTWPGPFARHCPLYHVIVVLLTSIAWGCKLEFQRQKLQCMWHCCCCCWWQRALLVLLLLLILVLVVVDTAEIAGCWDRSYGPWISKLTPIQLRLSSQSRIMALKVLVMVWQPSDV